MTRNPVVLIHGYSDRGESFQSWKKILSDRGFETASVFIGNYISLSNEITIKDIAEGLDMALRRDAGLDPDRPFDAVVHSTGMLVIRSWLSAYANGGLRSKRLKRLIALAPASFGSPLAHKGRSWLGSLFKGDKDPRGPDFLEAGDEVLFGLELGSKFTWDLALEDLIGKEARFTTAPDTPYVFTFCGNRGYKGLKGAMNPPGSDGTVRWAGCPLNTRKISLDLTLRPSDHPGGRRDVKEPWGNLDIPLIPIGDRDHGSLLREPSAELVELAVSALSVDSKKEFEAWLTVAQAKTRDTLKGMDPWQQFVVRAVDERGDAIPDWNLRLIGTKADKKGRLREKTIGLDAHSYSRDRSLRCFHVNLKKVRPESLSGLHLKLIAETGTPLVSYEGYGSSRGRAAGKWTCELDLTRLLTDKRVTFFYPFTTTLLEIKLNREPVTDSVSGQNRVFWFSADPGTS